MKIVEIFRQMACQFAVQPGPYCQTYLEQVFTADRVWALAIGLGGTLFGAFTTYAVQTALKRREEKRHLQERLIGFIMTTTRIISDMKNIQGLLEHYRRTTNPEYELWQAAHTLQFTPGFKPDLFRLECLTRLRSGRLMSVAMHLYGEYAALIDIIEAYNQLRLKFTAERRSGKSDDEEIGILWTNMVLHIDFIEKTAASIIAEASEVQQMTYEKSKIALGDATFLKLSED